MLRRAVLILLAAFLLSPVANAQSSQRIELFVKDVANKLVAVVNGPGTPQSKQRDLTTIIDSAVDVDEVARFCLGRHWRMASPEQQRRYTDLFHRVLVNGITAKLGEYGGVRVTMGPVTDGNAAMVIERPNNPPATVKWVIANMKIVDVVAEGTSLRLTQRQEYQSFLTRNNNDIDRLLDAMQRQAG